MLGRFLAATLTGLLLCCGAMAAGTVEIDGTTQSYTVTAGDNDTTNANTDFVVTSTGTLASNGTLTVTGTTTGTGTTWNAKSITVTSDDATYKGVFHLNGANDDIIVKLSGALSIGGNDTVGGEMRVTGVDGVLDAAGGATISGLGQLIIDPAATLDASATSFTVNTTSAASAISLVAGGKLTLNSLNFQAGALTLGVAGSTFSAEGDTVVGGYKATGATNYSTATLTLDDSGATIFKNSLTIKEGGTVTSGTANSAFSLGSGKTLTLAGGTLQASATGTLTVNADKVVVDGAAESVIDAANNNIVFNQANGAATSHSAGTTLTVKSDLIIKGGNTLAFHSYAQSGGTVTTPNSGVLHILKNSDPAAISGGTFAAAAQFDGGAAFTGSSVLKGTGQTITGGGAGKDFTFGAKTEIDLTGGRLTLANVEDAAIGGTIRFGGTATTANTLTTNGKVTFHEGADIKLAADFARVVTASGSATAANTLIATGGAGQLTTGLEGGSLTSDNFLLGRFTLKDDGQYLYVSEADKLGLTLDGSSSDHALAQQLIKDKYGNGVTGGFASNIYKSVVDPAAPAPYDRLKPARGVVAGSGSDLEKSYNMNLANLTAFATGDRRADGSLAAMYNGLNNSGVVDVAIATAEAVTVRTRDHLRRIGDTRAALRETIGSDSALAASFLNSEFDNRIWFGGFGMWEDADPNEGLGGYRYESAGFIGGYDYAYGPLSLGGTIAYTRGDFMDKTALLHDSKISSYSAGLHAAYYAPEGFFAVASTGYTFSRNNINELRSNPSVPAGQSWNEASYSTNTWTISAETGFDYRPVPCVNVTPSVGITYIGARNSDHNERLGGVMAGRITGSDSYGAYVPVRLEIGYEIVTGTESRLKLNARGGYAYNLNGNGIDGDFTLYGFSNAMVHKVVGRKPERHHYTGGAGLRFVTDQFDVGLDYDYSARSNYSAHRITATAGFRF